MQRNIQVVARNMKQVSNKSALKEIQNYQKLLREANVRFDSIILFGSQAMGTSKSHSDIDICVVSKDFGKNRHSERVALLKISNNTTIDIEPHPYHPNDLTNKWDPLASEIRKNGVVVS